MTHALLQLNELFDLNNFLYENLWNNTKYPWEALENLDSLFKSISFSISKKTDISDQAFLVNKELIHIEDGVVIEPGAYVKGPCILGKNTTVRHGAYIRGGVVTGEGCVIGHASEIKNSIFLNRVHAAHFAYIGDSILGNNVNIAAGCRLANLRLDHEEITVNIDGKKIKTGRKKLGSILADDVQIGCNAVLNPASIVLRGSAVFPLTLTSGLINAGVVAKKDGRILPFRKKKRS